MSGILLPGQENQPKQGGGIELPKGFSRKREQPAEPSAAAPTVASSAEVTEPAAAAQTPATDGAPREQPKVDLLFPPTGAQIQCPSCGTPYVVPVFSIIDLGVNPELKAPLLSGQINVAVCPSCGAGGPLSTPLMVHEPAHQFLGVFVPPSQGGIVNAQQQRAIGELTQTLMRKLPNEARKGYMLQPRQFMDWQRFMEQLWEFEGVTPEMLRRQRNQSELLQRLISLANDRKALEIALQRSGDLVDRDFFAMLDRLMMMAGTQRQPDGADTLLNLRNQLLDMTEAGKQVKARQEKVRGILASITAKTTREELLETMLNAWQGEDGKDIVGALAVAVAPLLDYQFLMLVTQKIDAATQAEERQQLEELRELILAVQQQQAQSQQAMAQQVQQVLQEILQANDIQVAVRQHADYIDETFLAVLAANIQAAQRNKSTAAVRRLQQVYDAAMDLIQENAPAEIRFLNELLGAPDRAAVNKLLQENRALLNSDFVDSLKEIENEMRAGGRGTIADRIKSLRAQIALMV